MNINRRWLGLALGFFGSLGFQYLDFQVKQRQWAMTKFESVTFLEWLSFYQVLMTTTFLGIVGHLAQIRAVAKRETLEIVNAMKASKKGHGED